ncbi:sulfur oxidation c-type cytochrome SoxA [Rhodobacter veldkampii DSM 11550]|uniref:SoxAX cytochrome complex subunit A n=2 Tax=Phaeovulum veldkampii TaxID=33049 RepID=A0A2T4JGY8_9RHOB|nr:sulfur oxidation c-type cytochrome SoxA [Phaeovulum veldkampii]MBK5947825.1 sulfur oxidation c-type cytochrome SoxA [Phaeovulum veldkampii DSM 11550]NCU19813.1 sulfur oxidation c-type cytochrome SoxA [Candidatus Falkowbacteria bacterium]PTE17113.1 sulfur oxidation c-type cytochrome SoxA [Phaeovulum veldkampii DSM 11550]
MLRKSRTTIAALALGAVTLGMTPALADPHPDAELVVNGEITIPTRGTAPAYLDGHLTELYSGWLFREDETRAMQMDDFDNPAMVFTDAGLEAWDTVEGTEGKSCATCHHEIESMAGVRAAMPKYNEKAGDLWSLEEYINACRTERMGAEKLKWNSDKMKAMTLALSIQSRGMPISVNIDGPSKPYWEQGREIYYTRYGQLEMSCANCHEDNWGNMIRADHLSQGHINAFPVYRLKDAGVVSIHQRFVGCVRDTRAETFEAGSPEFKALELYVASRGVGLAIEGAGVRP